MLAEDRSPEAVLRQAQAMAADAFRKAGGDRAEAVSLLAASIDADAAFKAALVEPMLFRQYVRMIADQAYEQRVRIARMAARPTEVDGGQPDLDNQNPGAAEGEGANLAVTTSSLPPPRSWTPPETTGAHFPARQHNAETVFDYQLKGGMKLGLATRRELQGEVDYWSGITGGAQRRKGFFSDVLAEMKEAEPDDQAPELRVQDAIPQEQLTAIMKRWGL